MSKKGYNNGARREMRKFLQGAQAIAEFVKLTKPAVISAYPITPQTPVVEYISKLCADGELKSEFINSESEHSAASIVLGASLSGARSYTASSSQGLMLMSEVLFNAAGSRAPILICCVNRALSAPINIWNDHQDSMCLRDSGIIQIYCESVQEAGDFHIIGYRIGEDRRISLPVMICIDGYTLSHGFEIVDIPSQEQVDEFLPPYQPVFCLDPNRPLTLGVLCDPDSYMETRYAIQLSMERVFDISKEVISDFKKKIGRGYDFPLEAYKVEDADSVIVAAGSVCGTIKEAIDKLRKDGKKVGLLKILLYRPFPVREIYELLKNSKEIAVMDRSISLGFTGPLYNEIKSLFQGKDANPKISGFICGLGGRDIREEDIFKIFERLSEEQVDVEFINIDKKKLFTELEEFLKR